MKNAFSDSGLTKILNLKDSGEARDVGQITAVKPLRRRPLGCLK
jgi:hypothetical protein